MELIGPYRILREIARGGMGVVYQALGPDGQQVALKLLLGQRTEDPRARKRFQLEIQAQARLRHPNVVSILNAGEHQGAPWLALDYVQGESLADRLRSGPLPVSQAIHVALQLAQALDYVHACSVLHRDLKPDNVLLRGSEVLLTDFGIARDLDASVSRMTASGVFMGTPGYWPPEQAQGKTAAIGPRSDVYGLGAVLYACLTGRAPVQATSLQEYLSPRAHLPPAPRALSPDVPPWLSELCLACLASDPEERPDSADAVARALLVQDPRRRSNHLATRSPHWPALAAGLGVVLLLVVGLGLALTLGPDSEPLASSDAELEPDSTTEPPPTTEPPTPSAEGPSPLEPEVTTALREAKALRTEGRHSDALARIEQALEHAPRVTLLHLERLTLIAHTRGDLEVIAAIGEALEVLPNDANLFAARGQTYLRLGRLSEGSEDLDRALSLDPDHAQALADRGLMRMRGRDSQGALADLDRALEVAPTLREAHHRQAMVLLDLRRYDESLAACERELERNPTFVPALLTQGQALFSLERLREAIEAFQHGLELKPGDPLLHEFRGRTYAKLARHRDAVADFDRVLELRPTYGSGYLERAKSKVELRDYEGALADYDQAVRLAPNNPDAYLFRGVLHAQRDRLEEALADYTRVLEFRPRADLYMRRADVLAQLKRTTEALADCDHSLELDPNQPKLHTLRGRQLHDLGRFDEALAAFDDALRLDPGHKVAWDMRGVLNLKLERWEAAVADFDRAIPLDPKDGKGYALRGQAKLRLGRPAEALTDFDQAERTSLPGPVRDALKGLRAEVNAALNR